MQRQNWVFQHPNTGEQHETGLGRPKSAFKALELRSDHGLSNP